jgi:hypothetical protein
MAKHPRSRGIAFARISLPESAWKIVRASPADDVNMTAGLAREYKK